MNKSRDLGKLIDDMKSLVPDGETDLLNALDRVKRDSVWTAPEAMGRHFHRVAEILHSAFGCPPTDLQHQWQRDVANLFAGRKVA